MRFQVTQKMLGDWLLSNADPRRKEATHTNLRRHYAHACHEWADRPESDRDCAIAIADERRVRIRKVYLAGRTRWFLHSKKRAGGYKCRPADWLQNSFRWLPARCKGDAIPR
ncbi:MAG: hypothetical protein DWQ09_01470 [Proteobacteria bacterium]|nr:MAG: hypothetical protein DWQ09_01470 [Pseudomonadota bacterium]QKK12159.1 MAG: hypothetical protein HND59_11810 [Pseudomonadota bacterium]